MHAFLWFLDGSPQLSPHARSLMEDGLNDMYLSAVSLWEMAIKLTLHGGSSPRGAQATHRVPPHGSASQAVPPPTGGRGLHRQASAARDTTLAQAERTRPRHCPAFPRGNDFPRHRPTGWSWHGAQ